MNKSDVIDFVANCAGITKAQANRSIRCYHKAINGGLKEDGKVSIRGFGTYEKVKRKARKGRDPQTGKPIRIKAKNVVKFRAGKTLRAAV